MCNVPEEERAIMVAEAPSSSANTLISAAVSSRTNEAIDVFSSLDSFRDLQEEEI